MFVNNNNNQVLKPVCFFLKGGMKRERGGKRGEVLIWFHVDFSSNQLLLLLLSSQIRLFQIAVLNVGGLDTGYKCVGRGIGGTAGQTFGRNKRCGCTQRCVRFGLVQMHDGGSLGLQKLSVFPIGTNVVLLLQCGIDNRFRLPRSPSSGVLQITWSSYIGICRCGWRIGCCRR